MLVSTFSYVINRKKLKVSMVLRKYVLYISTVVMTFCIVGHASANPLVFQGQNAGLFPGANPSDIGILMDSVPKPTPDTAPTTALSAAATVLQELESQASSNVFGQIVGPNSTSSGSEFFGDGSSVVWIPDPNIAGNRLVTFTQANGSTTTVSLANN